MLCGIWRLTLRRTQCQRPARCRQSSSAPPPPSPAAAPRLPSICEYARHRIPASISSGFGQAMPGQAAVALCEGVQVWRDCSPPGVCLFSRCARCLMQQINMWHVPERSFHYLSRPNDSCMLRCTYAAYTYCRARGVHIAGLQGKLN